MNIAELSIAVRERGVAEIYDLSLLVLRKYWWQLCILIGLPYAALLCLNIALIYQGPRSHFNDHWTIWPYVLLMAEIPLLTAASTVFLGNALFHGNCALLHCFRTAFKQSARLLVACIMKPLILITPAHMCEVYLLEQLKGSRAWKRGNRLMSGWRQDYLAQFLINCGIGFLFMGLAILLIHQLSQLLLYADQPFTTDFSETVEESFFVYDLEHHIFGHFVIFPLVVYFAVVRFLSYINLRTVREGWSTELQMKDASLRIFGADES